MAYSEPYDKMDSKTLDISKAITSLREELEAVDWYNQRVVTATDEELKRIMAHNRDEEKEHAANSIAKIDLLYFISILFKVTIQFQSEFNIHIESITFA